MKTLILVLRLIAILCGAVLLMDVACDSVAEMFISSVVVLIGLVMLLLTVITASRYID